MMLLKITIELLANMYSHGTTVCSPASASTQHFSRPLTDSKPPAHPSPLWGRSSSPTSGLVSNKLNFSFHPAERKGFSHTSNELVSVSYQTERLVLRSLAAHFSGLPSLIFAFHKHTSVTRTLSLVGLRGWGGGGVVGGKLLAPHGCNE